MIFKSWSELGKRLMEIKEEQLLWERRQQGYLESIDCTLTGILKELKGREKDGNKNRRLDGRKRNHA